MKEGARRRIHSNLTVQTVKRIVPCFPKACGEQWRGSRFLSRVSGVNVLWKNLRVEERIMALLNVPLVFLVYSLSFIFYYCAGKLRMFWSLFVVEFYQYFNRDCCFSVSLHFVGWVLLRAGEEET